jgi:2,3-bisphosphoglycerate-independent phosphoglycerate mutase
MVGHTGSIPAVVAAVEAVDRCLGRVVECVERAGGTCLITADHGNAEVMLEPNGTSPHTAHTSNPVPFVVTNDALRARDGRELSDIAPTILDLLELSVPAEMTGTALATRL